MDNQILASTPDEARTLRRALLDAAESLGCVGIESAKLDAQVLLGHVLALDKTDLFLRLNNVLSPYEEARFQALLQRRGRREPVAYITGSKEFWSLDFAVDRNVLIPRPETELLVEWALKYAARMAARTPLRICDIGTGSGAIAVCLANQLRTAQLSAVDISAGALQVARGNAERHGAAQQINFFHGDLFAPFEDQSILFDLILANPPYIRRQELSELAPEIREWEPITALDGGADGLDCYRRIVASAPLYLADGGSLLLEIGAGMGDALTQLLAHTEGFAPASVYRDFAGQERVVVAMKGKARG